MIASLSDCLSDRAHARFEKREELNRILDEAWEAVASEDNDAGRRAGVGRGVGEGAKPPKPLEVSGYSIGQQ